MNIKYLAFEVNPVNHGNSLSGMGENILRSQSYLQEIEERLRARAGNPVINQDYSGKHNNKSSIKSEPMKDEKSNDKSLSQTEIQKIIDEFKF
jgi:hypothetical protein